MEFVKAAVLGLIQGLTEFFPVSSSGHLIIFPYFFKWEQPTLFFAVLLHLGTLLSLLVIMYKDILNVIKIFFKGLFIPVLRKDDNFRTALYIIIAIIPAAAAGYFFSSTIEKIFDKPFYVAIFLLVTAAVLFIFEQLGKRNEKKYVLKKASERNINYFSSLITGIAQAVAILPGISRSGFTISATRIFGIKREKAVKYSFLISIPVIFGSFIYELYGFLKTGTAAGNTFSLPALITGFFIAFLAGLFAIKFLIKLSVKRNLNFFAVYCVVLAIIFFIVYFYRK